MADKDKFKQFLPDRKSENLSFDAPIKEQPVVHDRIPSGLDPMGQIRLEGRAYKSLGSGRIPWWVIVSGWIFFGIPAALTIYLYTIAISLSWTSIPVLAIAAISLLILWKGTKAKLSHRSQRRL